MNIVIACLTSTKLNHLILQASYFSGHREFQLAKVKRVFILARVDFDTRLVEYNTDDTYSKYKCFLLPLAITF